MSSGVAPGTTASWPELTLAWEDTRDTLQLWSQVVGKVCLALQPMVNHWWQITFHLTAHGLRTPVMFTGGRALDIEFDFVDHALVIRTSGGEARRVALQPQSVAAFYTATMAALDDLDVHVPMLARPVEIPVAIPFAEDEQHRSYDAAAAHRFWLALLQAHRVMERFRARFVGKSSPVHFFWGGFDLAVTRFSGRRAPKHPGGIPNVADWVNEMAYSHEVSSCGFWPGGSAEGSFYAYAYPTPDGYAQWPVQPAGIAFFEPGLGDFLLPYAAVRTAEDPDAMLLSFFQSAYEGAAELSKWDRAALEADDIDSNSNGAGNG